LAEAFGVTFGAPLLLWLAAGVPAVLLLLVVAERRRVAIARRFISERLRGVANPARAIRPWLVSLALLAAVIALAAPRAGFKTMPIEARESNRVVAIDVSRSMSAEDVGASRLDAAKAIAKRIVDAQPGRVGLVIFESAAEVVAPLTSDDEAVKELLDSIQPGELSMPGTDLAAALNTSLRLVDADPMQRGDVVVISDGEDQSSRLTEAIAKMKSRGVTASTILIGSTAGSTIPDENHRNLVDDEGQTVVTYAHPENLQRIATESGGRYYENPFGEHALDTLAASGGRLRQRNVKVPIERYQWPLAVAFFAMFVGSVVGRGGE
jgi:Ca-activated chloride channel family protein